MRAAYVTPARTPITIPQAIECMRWALKCELGTEPSDEALALALAKTALETGRWKAIWNSNWGNVKAPDSYQGMFTCITLNEVLVRQGKRVLVWFAPEGELTGNPAKGGKLIGRPLPVPDGHPQTRMKAFANRYDGALSYVHFVAGGHYREAWRKLLTGDARGYVHALKAAKYFTADEGPYADGVVSLQREMLGRVRNEPVDAPDLEWEAIVAALPGVRFSVDDLLNSRLEEP